MTENEIIDWLIFLVALIIICLLVFGCTQTIIEKDVEGNITVKINTFLKDIDFDKVWYRDVFGIERYAGDSKNIRIITPYGTGEITDGD
jgi:hypothetical protein